MLKLSKLDDMHKGFKFIGLTKDGEEVICELVMENNKLVISNNMKNQLKGWNYLGK